MKIYMFKNRDVYKFFPNYVDANMVSEWNELDELPKEVIELMKIAKRKDTVYTPDNFMFDFNLQDEHTYHGDWIMFIPDAKFNVDSKCCNAMCNENIIKNSVYCEFHKTL